MQSWTFYLGCLKSLVECICVCFWVNVFCLWWPAVSSIHIINTCCWVMFLLYKMNKKAIDGSTAGHNFLLLGTNTHPFNGPFSETTQVSRYQKGKTNLDFTEARDSEWQWHQLGYMQVCILLQTDNHSCFFTGWMPFLPPNQQHQRTEGNFWVLIVLKSPKSSRIFLSF